MVSVGCSAAVFLSACLSAGIVFAAGAAAQPPADLHARIDALIEQMGTDHYAGKAAHDQLVTIGEPAVPALLKAAEDRKPLRRWWAISALCLIGDARAVDVLLRRMRDPHPTVRHVAIYHGKAFVRRDRRVAEAVMAMVESPASGNVEWAVEGLGRARYRPALPAINKAAEHPEPKVRWRALEALQRIDAGASIPRFIDRLRQDTAPAVRRLAASCLAQARVRDQRTIDALVGALRDRSPEVRVAALRSLRGLTGKTFGAEEPIDDVPREVAVKATRWWLADRQRYPPVGRPGGGPPASQPAGPPRDGGRAPS